MDIKHANKDFVIRSRIVVCPYLVILAHKYPPRVTLFYAEAYHLPHSGNGCCGRRRGGLSKGDDAETIIPLNTLFGVQISVSEQ